MSSRSSASALLEWLGRILRLPSNAERVAREALRRVRPDERIAWSCVAADEADRFVVGIYHGQTRPPRCAFWAVDKTTGEATQVEDDAAYRPKLWR